MTSKGQITIPVSIRRALQLSTGSRVDFLKRGDGYIIVPSTRHISRLAGYFGPHVGDPVTVDQMNEDIAEAMGTQ